MINRVYLDNAATTPLDPRVIDVIAEVYRENYGNPSATHSIGRNAKGILEINRKKIADLLQVKSSEIFFTSGGTEADNLAIRTAVKHWGIKHIITSPIEHKAVLDTSLDIQKKGLAEVHMVNLESNGRVQLAHLEELLEAYPGSLVSLMHANNEIGTLNPLKEIGEICHKYDAIFHSDTVQTMGHYAILPEALGVDLLSCSAHKFNGPKGVGFLYVNQRLKAGPIITGGGQERNTRAGTENVPGIAGMALALEICYAEMEEQHQKIQSLKTCMMEELKNAIPEIQFNGDISPEGSLYTVLNVSLPPHHLNDMMLFRLDIEGVCVSGGSACNSGAQKGSHVLAALNHPADRMAIRFSFGKYNTMEEILFAIQKLKQLLQVEVYS